MIFLSQFDLIFLDAFSPIHCPELWTEEFIQGLANELKPNGRLITYCRAAAVRGSLRRAGLQLNSLQPKHTSIQNSSSATIAFKNKLLIAAPYRKFSL